MMGERRVMQEALFYEFSLDRHVPSDHSEARPIATTRTERCPRRVPPRCHRPEPPEARQTHPNARSQNGVKRTDLVRLHATIAPSLAPVTDFFNEICQKGTFAAARRVSLVRHTRSDEPFAILQCCQRRCSRKRPPSTSAIGALSIGTMLPRARPQTREVVRPGRAPVIGCQVPRRRFSLSRWPAQQRARRAVAPP